MLIARHSSFFRKVWAMGMDVPGVKASVSDAESAINDGIELIRTLRGNNCLGYYLDEGLKAAIDSTIGGITKNLLILRETNPLGAAARAAILSDKMAMLKSDVDAVLVQVGEVDRERAKCAVTNFSNGSDRDSLKNAMNLLFARMTKLVMSTNFFRAALERSRAGQSR